MNVTRIAGCNEVDTEIHHRMVGNLHQAVLTNLELIRELSKSNTKYDHSKEDIEVTALLKPQLWRAACKAAWKNSKKDVVSVRCNGKIYMVTM